MAEHLTRTFDYENDFDPEWFIENYHHPKTLVDLFESPYFSILDQLHQLFASGKIKGNRLLDVGTGPCIQSIISASDHVDEIYLSDFTTRNRQVLTEWLKSKRDLNVLSCQYIVEKQGSSISVEEKLQKIRSQVKAILSIDVTKDAPLLDGGDVIAFDVITSKFCLEAASRSIGEYRRCVNNTMSLLKPEGHFVLIGLLENQGYRVGNFFFADISLKKDDIIKAFEDAGACDIKFYDQSSDDKINHLTKHVCIMVAKKKETVIRS